jgi:preprotein translocase subunit SecE
LTGTERAVLSPMEKEIARTTWPQKQQENIL